MIPPAAIEIAVLILGMIVLMFETLAPQIDKRMVAMISLTGLIIVFVATFFLSPGPLR